jgi:serine/threonine-protein kinase
MSSETQVSEVLLRWEELRGQGCSPSPEDLCRDCPEHLPEVRRQLAAIQAIYRVMDMGAADQLTPPPGPPVDGAGRETVTLPRALGAGAALGAGLPTPPESGAGPAPRAGPALGAGLPKEPPGWPEVPGYEILGELGRGGMGVVYQARQVVLDRLVALKVIRAAELPGARERARFRDEALAVARLQHPNIVQIHDAGEHGGRPYCVLEYLDGGSLARKIGGQSQPPREAARLVATLARAVAAAHEEGIIHRDLKPANVLLAADGTPKISDFGLAKRLEDSAGRTRTGAILGTPSYMAPEQAKGKTKEIGPAADIHALGVILYELLTGQTPFRGDSDLETLQQIVSQEPEPPSRRQEGIPGALEAICLRCLAKEPQDRYPSAQALAEDLGRFLAGEALPPPLPRPAPARARRWQWVAAAAGLLIAVGALAALVFSFHPDGGSPEPLKGWIDVQVYKSQRQREPLRLNDPEALPLRPGDMIAVQAELNRPAYLYVLWIDTRGRVRPVYPWKPGHWESRPEVERPVRRLRRPEALDMFYPMEKEPAGIETLVLLAREEPLPPEVDLQAEFGKLPRQRGRNLDTAVWFENGQIVRDEEERAPRFEPVRRGDPVLAAQQRVRALQRRLFAYSRAVSFATRGR